MPAKGLAVPFEARQVKAPEYSLGVYQPAAIAAPDPQRAEWRFELE